MSTLSSFLSTGPSPVSAASTNVMDPIRHQFENFPSGPAMAATASTSTS